MIIPRDPAGKCCCLFYLVLLGAWENPSGLTVFELEERTLRRSESSASAWETSNLPAWPHRASRLVWPITLLCPVQQRFFPTPVCGSDGVVCVPREPSYLAILTDQMAPTIALSRGC